LVRWLGSASQVVGAVSTLVGHIAGLLRQLFHVVGWLILLVSSVSLAGHPGLSVGHLIGPGAGALAVLQGYIKPLHGWRRSAPLDPPSDRSDAHRGPTAGESYSAELTKHAQ
jgi:hypothetical protein